LIIHFQTLPFRACLLVILGSLLAACGGCTNPLFASTNTPELMVPKPQV
jgi:hypothetical protein